ncbi:MULTISPECIES: hypothetical protein [Streptomyces]|uniref:hypothetical protein n=1 Tax=Streptomyces TaxID=1883 RepID=UPI0004C5370C|nr:hypothetical protein [Streptomyces griseolus]
MHPLFTAFLDGAEATGIPRFDSANGALMEADSGCAVRDENIRDGDTMTCVHRAETAACRKEKLLLALPVDEDPMNHSVAAPASTSSTPTGTSPNTARACPS